MDLVDKSVELINLYDLYQDLLTSKQRSYFEQYYFDDFSITEISENMDVSRNAVHDLIKRTVQKLDDYEAKLKLYEVQVKRRNIIVQLQEKIEDQELLVLLDKLHKVE